MKGCIRVSEEAFCLYVRLVAKSEFALFMRREDVVFFAYCGLRLVIDERLSGIVVVGEFPSANSLRIMVAQEKERSA